MSAFDIVFVVALGLASIWSMLWFPDIPRGTEGHHEALATRFKLAKDQSPKTSDDDPASGAAAVAYVDRIVDRQLTKVRGILAFDGLMLTFLGLVARGLPTLDIASLHKVPLLLLMATLATSSGLCLSQFRARWGYVADLQTFSSEIAATFALARRRSFWIERAVRLSLLALAGVAALLAATLAGI